MHMPISKGGDRGVRGLRMLARLPRCQNRLSFSDSLGLHALYTHAYTSNHHIKLADANGTGWEGGEAEEARVWFGLVTSTTWQSLDYNREKLLVGP